MRIAVIDELLALYYSQPGTKGHCLTVLDHPLLHYYSLTQYSKLNSSLQVHSILAVLTQSFFGPYILSVSSPFTPQSVFYLIFNFSPSH